MKRLIIGCFLGLIGSIWSISIIAFVYNNLLGSWYGSRFWHSAAELGMAIPLGVSLFVTALGFIILIGELFRKNP